MNLAQTTLQSKIKLDGIGLFSGKEVTVHLLPARANTGIQFIRTDLEEKPVILASVDNISTTLLNCTVLKDRNTSVQTVEHLLSALYALGIDNLIIEINNLEVPIFDGSSKFFVDEILKVGIKTLDQEKKVYVINSPLYYEDNDVVLIALPSKTFRISYTWYNPRSKAFRSQYFSSDITQKIFIDELCFCRTFAFYEDISLLLKQNKVKGASLEQGILIREDRVVNELGLRCENELANHKVLDLIGDLSLLGWPLEGHIIALRSGHKSNVTFAKKIKQQAELRSLCPN